MKKNRFIGISAWFLILVLANVLLFCLTKEVNGTVIATAIFVEIAFVSSLVFQLLIWRRNKNIDEQFLNIPSMVVLLGYMVIQIPICIIFALASSIIPYKAAILINAILLIVAWLLVLGSISGNDHIQRVNKRQKDYHVKL
ncbi:hypothetical protein R0131_05510 [Clostridium sp. AL.422]|uniref:hypothetical protein n=1 Tax=Clostridium TaxID=1485 RepID=UPI00293DBEAA|nr:MULTISPECIES: hypothetical protein [unclassified Clostridium]MDV4150284.1 hypothetical protein [Clostridium sp. AL.422]